MSAPATAGALTLAVRGLSFSYSRRTRLLSDVSWSPTAGVKTVLLGPNGAGKTTLLKLMAGALRPAVGGMHLNGSKNAASVSELRREVSWMPQEVVALKGLKVREQVAYAGWLGGLSNSEAKAATLRVLDSLGLTELASRKTHTLSGGQLRRVGLAEAIVRPSSVVLLDEPTVGLDPAQRRGFRELLSSAPHTMVVSTHQIDDIDDVFDRVAVLVDGQIRFDGSMSEFMAMAPEQGHRTAEHVFSTFVPEGSH